VVFNVLPQMVFGSPILFLKMLVSFLVVFNFLSQEYFSLSHLLFLKISVMVLWMIFIVLPQEKLSL
jgi:hypothetical protein